MDYTNDIERALWAAAKHQLPAHVITGPKLTEAIVHRSLRYTSERQELKQSGLADLAARALFFTCADAPKIHWPLAELDRSGLLPKKSRLRVADIGAGVGAMTLGTLCYLANKGRVPDKNPIEVLAVDNDRDALDLLHHTTNHLPAIMQNITMRTHKADVTSWKCDQTFDLVLVGNVLNELSESHALALVTRLTQTLDENGSLILIEPALRETTRSLHRLRDIYITKKLGHIFAPCTRTQEPCPALFSDGDWCHEDRPVTLPERTRKLGHNTGLRQHGLKFSYLVIRRQPAPLVASYSKGDTPLRVVSRLFKRKGQLSCTVCGANTNHTMRLLKRDRSDQNRSFNQIRRGDILITQPTNEIERTQEIVVVRL